MAGKNKHPKAYMVDISIRAIIFAANDEEACRIADDLRDSAIDGLYGQNADAKTSDEIVAIRRLEPGKRIEPPTSP